MVIGCPQDRIMVFAQPGQGDIKFAITNTNASLNFHAQAQYISQFNIQLVPGQPELGDAIRQHAAGLVFALEY